MGSFPGRARFAARVAMLGLAIAPTALAIDPSVPVARLLREAWSVPEGLPQATVRAVVQDGTGYVWIGTEEGLARFDGVRFRVFDSAGTPELPKPDVRSLLVSRDGSLVIGTGGGLARLSGGRFTREAGGLPGRSVEALAETVDGTLWIGTDSGLFVREGSALRRLATGDGLAGDAVRVLLAGRDGTVWVGTRTGLTRIAGERFETWHVADGLPHEYVTSLCETSGGEIWIGTNGGGVAVFRDGRFVTMGSHEGLPVQTILAVFEDRDRQLWVGTNGGGLCRFDGARFSCVAARDGFPADIVWSLGEDREGGLWVGAVGSGLFRLHEGRFTTYGTADGLVSEIALAVTEDRSGAMWVGTAGGGLSRFRDGRFTTFGTKDGLPHPVVLSLEPDPSGDLWVGTAGGGLTRFSNGRFTTRTTRDGLSSNLVQAILVARDGTLWIGTNGGGLCHLEGSVFRAFGSAEGLQSISVTSLLEEENGSILVGTEGAGLVRCRNGRLTSLASIVAARSILDLARTADGSVWVGTIGEGLVRLRGDRAVTIRKKDGLFDDLVGRILEDGRGNLWMGSNKGVSRTRQADLDAFADGRISSFRSVSYGTADGMRSRETNGGFRPAGWRATDGRLWFPTSMGVAVVDPARLYDNPVPPPVVVESVRIDGREVAFGDAVDVGAGARSVEIAYTALSFAAPRSVRLRYRLEGFDESWIEAGTRRTAYYTNLPPGDYVFGAAASSADGVPSARPALVTLRVAGRFTRTPLFFGLCLGAALAVGLGASRWRLARARGRERELLALVGARERAEEELRSYQGRLEQLVGERTGELSAAVRELEAFSYSVSHDLRAPLRAVEGFSRVLAEDHGSGLGEEGQRLLEVIRSRTGEMQRIIEGLLRLSHSGARDLRRTTVDMTVLARGVWEELFEADGRPAVDFVLDPLPETHGDPDLLRHVWANLLSNALKYSAPKADRRIRVRGRREEGGNVYEIEDHGIGFDPADCDRLFLVFSRLNETTGPKGTGVGLALVRRIVERHGGTVGASGRPGEGATFWFRLPHPAPGGAPPSG